MSDSMKKLLQPLLALPPAKRWIVAGVASVSIISFTILIVVANRTDYKPLFTNLTSEDAGEIVNKLKEQKIPHQIGSDGKSILVPSDKVYDLRLSLASDGLPQGGGVGFEIFDRKNFGMTEFVQKLNYQRALQGELSRTISQLSGVEQARVHLAIPEKSIFKESEKPPTASVVLKMKSNRMLRESEIQGVVHLVASAVDGMDADNVSVLDSRGKLLSKSPETDSGSRMTSSMLETQRNYEKNLEERLQSLLDKAVGPGKSVARVNATFDFKRVEKYEEKYDPESPVVRSEQRTEEKSGSGAASATGVPGVQSNLGKTAPAASPLSSTMGSKSDETMNYEISRSTARIIEPVGTLSKVSVAVMVDGKYVSAGNGKSSKPKYVSRTPDELQKIESLVKSAVGFNVDRGDQLTVANIPFQDAEQDMEDTGSKWWNAPIIQSLLKNLLIGFGFIAILILVIRPLMKMLRAPQQPVQEAFVPLEEDDEQKIAAAKRTQLTMQSVNQLELAEQIKKDPYQAAQILQNWLRQKE
jgi:flagellar M-ring protein FliF